MYDLSAIGDILLDFTPMAPSLAGNDVFECNAGGTVANLCSAAGKMGLKTLLVGKIGYDQLGRKILDTIAQCNVDISGCSTDHDAFTTQAIVTLKNGERSFSFARKYAADIRLKLSDVPMEKILDTKILHFSGMCLTDEPIRSTTRTVLEKASEKSLLISLDVNYRESLWHSEAEAIEMVREFMPYVDIFKSSEEEILMVTGADSLSQAADEILTRNARLVIVSCGPRGAFFKSKTSTGHVSTYDTAPVDTTGAGDCFMAAILYQILRRGGIEYLNRLEIEKMLDFANAAGAQSITRRGGVSSMPTVEEIEAVIKSVPRLVIP